VCHVSNSPTRWRRYPRKRGRYVTSCA
jgi:hypothetical protein